MKWWNVIKNEMMDMGGATGSEIKPAKDMEEAREHNIDPEIAEDEKLNKKLVGGQKKLDKDKDGDIDAKDLRELREER